MWMWIRIMKWKEKKWGNVGKPKPTSPLNENVVCHKQSCYSILSVATDVE